MTNAPTLDALPPLTALRVSNGALKSDKLPERIKIFQWGENPSTKGTFKVGDRTAQILPLNQLSLGFERVPIDCEHCTVPGSPEYIKGQPKAIFGYGTVKVQAGDGVYLEGIAWTPLGASHARNYEDLSPSAHFDDDGELDFLHSVALTTNGCLHGVTFFSATEPGKQSGGHDSPPAGYPQSADLYADPKNFRYPIDTEEHCRAAWSYIHQEKNRSGYTPAELNYIEERIVRAAKRFGIAISQPPTTKNMSDTNATSALPSAATPAEAGKFITLAALAGALGLDAKSDEAAVCAKIKTLAAAPASAEASAGRGAVPDLKVLEALITPLSAKIAALEKKITDRDSAATETEKSRIITSLAAKGQAPVNPVTGKPYSAEELKKLDLSTLSLLSANTPATVPLGARTNLAGQAPALDPNLKGIQRAIAAHKLEVARV